MGERTRAKLLSDPEENVIELLINALRHAIEFSASIFPKVLVIFMVYLGNGNQFDRKRCNLAW